jgi:hypothetical protein
MSAFASHPLAVAALGGLIAAWLLPAIAQQWQDRQKERELKRDIATQLDRDSTSTIIAVRILVDRSFPEAQTAAARRAELAAAPPSQVARATSILRAARERERDVGTRIYVRTFSDWLVTRSVTRSTLEAQFTNHALTRQWEDFADHVTDYLRLAGRSEKRQREKLVRSLENYVGAAQGVAWETLATPPDSVPKGARRAYSSANAHMAELLLERKKTIVEDVLAAHAAGYNSRPRDFIRTLFPFLG